VDFSAGLYDDLSRRDFTINAMAWQEEKGLVDPFGGTGI
jgi:tRNA nucleotidyltransferase (CCA-adding enzyme)